MGTDALIATCRYDGLGRRIRKYVPDGGNWTVTEYYYSVARQVVEVRRDGGKTRSGSPLSEPTLATTLREQYIWSPRYVNAPILRDRDNAAGGDLGKSGSGLDERLYYLTDANMNVTTLADTGGDAVERYTYDPYGKVTIYDGTWTNTRNSSSYDNSILYCGYYRDNETGLYHVDHRTYHPLFGRWLQRDPLGYADGMNLYESVRSRPTAVVDPSGCGLIVPGDPAWNNDPAAPPPAKTEKSAVDKIMDDIASGKIRSVNELRDRAKSLKPEQQQELVEQLEERFGNPPGSGGGKGAGGDWRKYAGISWDAIRGMSKKQMEAESAKIDRAIEEPYSGPYGAFKAITNPKGTGGLMLAGATAIVGGPAIVSAAEQALIKAGQAVAVSGEAIVATGTAVVAKASELSNNPAVVRAGDTLSALAARAMDSRPGQFATGVVQGMLPGMPQATGDNWRDAGQLVGQKIDEVPGVMADLANKAATTVVDYSRNAYYWAAGGSTSAANR